MLRKYAPELIYGAVDGTVTTFAIVAASVGAGLSSGVVLVLGIANVIADGFSMGSSAYLSDESDVESDHSKKSSKATALATFAAFIAAGMVPISAYLYDVIIGNAAESNRYLFLISVVMTLLTFVAIGYFKSRIEADSAARAIATTVVLGVVSASLAYFAGEWLARLLGVSV
jgi:VIT1/CCC1 family predicted Fe2+/Mn2+ transporter